MNDQSKMRELSPHETLLRLAEPLPIDAIEFRVQSINRGGYCTILAYKDARADMNRLDGVLGPHRWQRKHELINGHLFCSVGIYVSEQIGWVWKQDVGVESQSEATKGQASDAFKRACFNLGIGRELYAFPVISVKLNSDEFTLPPEGSRDKPRATWKLNLREWAWYGERNQEGELTFLAAADSSGATRFKWGNRGEGERA